MEKKLTMPRLRPEMENGVLCAWLKEEGDAVQAGEPLYEIETDKVVNQIEATESGVLKKQLCEEGDVVDAVNRGGEVVCKGTVLAVTKVKSYSGTAVVRLKVPMEHVDEVRSMKRLPRKDMKEV